MMGPAYSCATVAQFKVCLLYRLEIQELKLEESAQTVVELTERLRQYEDDLERKESVSVCSLIHACYDTNKNSVHNDIITRMTAYIYWVCEFPYITFY